MDDSLEATSQSFIIKVWVEEQAEGADPGVWQGHITHVTSGRRYYLRHLDDISCFIMPYLKEMGVQSGPRQRMRLWLQKLLGRL